MPSFQTLSSENVRFAGKLSGAEPSFLLSLPAGRTLAEVLEADSLMGSPPLCGRLTLALELCSLVRHLHQNGIVHRDLKPENIVLGETGGLYLQGFEHAKILGAPELLKKELPSFIGTPGYAPPEQLRNPTDLFEVRSDLFSFGAILYELITGQRAFIASNHLALILCTLDKTPTPPSRLSTNCPTALDALCVRLLAKIKEQRPASAEEVLTKLSVCLTDLQSPQTKPPGSQEASSPLAGGDLPAEPSLPPPDQVESPPSSQTTLLDKPSMTPVGSGGMSTGRLRGFVSMLGGSLPTVEGSFYQIERELARGGLGKILKAKDTRLGRDVAVKELLHNQGNAKARFLREAMITARLQHPAIVPMYEAGRWPSGDLFYTMKLVSGRPLDRLIASANTLEQRLALLPNAQVVCEAMAYAHDHLVIHRDLKPQNVLVGDYGETVVIDWGLAKDLRDPEEDSKEEASEHYRASAQKEGLTLDGEVMGTPAYMPNEQARGQPVDARADVYALGAILYHILSGQAPYRDKATRSREVLWALLQGPPMPLEEKEKRVPRDLLAIVNKAMARDVKERYPSAKELAEELQKFMTGKLVDAHHYTTAEKISRFITQNKAAVSVSAVLGVVMLVLVGFYQSSLITQRDVANRASAVATMRKNEAELATERAEALQKKERQRVKELTLEQARNQLEKDPAKTLSLLKSIFPEYPAAGVFRTLAAAALSKGIPQVLGENGRLPGHTAAINWVAYSPDGSQLASASNDNTVRLWKITESKAVSSLVLSGHTKPVVYLEFSPDGKRLASASSDHTARIWSTTTGQQLFNLEGHSDIVLRSAFSHDGLLLATAGYDKNILIWDTITGAQRKRLTGHTDIIRDLAFSRDDSSLASVGKDASARLWSLARNTSQILQDPVVKRRWELTDVEFSPDGKEIAVIGPASLRVYLWNIVDQSLRTLEGYTEAPNRVAFSPDGNNLATTDGGGSVFLWDLVTATSTQLLGHESSSNSPTFSPDGKLLATASNDYTVRLWDVATKQAQALRGHRGFVSTVAFSPDGETLASSGDDATIRLWRVREIVPKNIAGHQLAVFDLAFSANGKELVSAGSDKTIRIHDFSTNNNVRILNGHTDAVFGLDISPDGFMLASASWDQTARLWDWKTGKELWVFSGHSGWVNAVSFSPDNLTLATASDDTTIRIWSVETGQLLQTLKGHEDAVQDVKFSPDGETLLSVSFDGSARLWQVSTSKEIAKLEAPSRKIWKCAFSPDGSTAAIVGKFSSVILWDLSAPDAKRDLGWGLLPGQDEMIAVAFSPDGKTLATVGKELYLWDLAKDASTQPEVRTCKDNRLALGSVAFSWDAQLVAVGGLDRLVQLWPDTLPHSAQQLESWLSLPLGLSDF
jgi:eukaryotic-like serine/threonine-protein kinase